MNALAFYSPLLLGGLIIGTLLGVVLERSRFCMVSALANFVLTREMRQVQAWLAALAIALIGTASLEVSGLVAVAESGYRTTRLDWFGAILGGFSFGFGAMLAGGCAGRTLINSASGNLGSLLALVLFAAGAYAMLFGPLEPVRVALANATTWNTSLADGSIAAVLQRSTAPVSVAALLCVMAGLTMACRDDVDGQMIAAGCLVGALVVAGWWVTGDLGAFDAAAARPDSISYGGPIARVVQGLFSETMPGSPFGPGLVAGTLVGAALSALATRSFRWIIPRRDRLVPLATGGLLMGLGASFAGGCNLGHGITGLATLSIKSLLASVAIAGGMGAGLIWLGRE